MTALTISGFQYLNQEWRNRRDGRDCTWNIVVTVAEGRGLKGLGPHGLNDCFLKVNHSSDMEDDTNISKTHPMTSAPFFNHVFKLPFSGQPAAFFSSTVQVEVLHDRGTAAAVLGHKRIGLVQVMHRRDHTIHEFDQISFLSILEEMIVNNKIFIEPDNNSLNPLHCRLVSWTSFICQTTSCQCSGFH